MTTSSVGSGSIKFTGLASGLDTAGIISSLMQVESAPQTALKARLATTQSQTTALQQLNTAMASLSSSAASFATGSTWTQLTATSSNSAFSVTAASTATQASVNVSVQQSATNAAVVISGTNPFTAGSTYAIATTGGKTASFTVGGTGSITDVAAAINATSKTSGLQAVVIDPNGTPSLEIRNTATGDTSNFTISQAGTTVLDSGSANSTGITNVKGLDAKLTVDGVSMTSASNTVTAMSGVQVTIPAGVTPSSPQSSTISIVDDGTSRANALKTFIGQINGVITTIGAMTSYGTLSTTSSGATPVGGGVLPGDSTLRDLATQLVNTIFPTGTTGLDTYGISVDQDGSLTFDADTFTAAYQADPDGTQAAILGKTETLADGTTKVTPGFAQRVQTVADLASDPDKGSLTQYITNEKDQINEYTDQISQWDVRLADKQASLEQIYTNLEMTLSSLQSQQSWLSSQLSSLDSGWMQNN